MASDTKARIQSRIHDREIIVHCLAPRFPELQESMVVGARSEDSGLAEPYLLHDLEIGFDRANPSGDLGEFVAAREASIHRVAISLRVHEELGLPDDAVGAAQSMQHA